MKWSFPCTCIQVLLIASIFLSGCASETRPTVEIRQELEDVSELKLKVKNAGLYHLTWDELASAGMRVRNPTDLRLSVGEQPIPIWIEETYGDFDLYFYGVPPESMYTRENIYWLKMDEMDNEEFRSMGTLEIGELPGNLEASYRVRKVFCEKKAFSPLLGGDPWYWLSIFAPSKQTLDLDLGEVASGEATLKIQIWGTTQAQTEYDHHLRVMMNDHLVLDEWWDGSGKKSLEVIVADGILRPGSNQMTFDAPGDTGALADAVFLQTVEFTYAQQDAAEDQFALLGEGRALEFAKPSGTIEVFDVTQPYQPIRLIGLDQPNGKPAFWAEKDREYLVVTNGSTWVPGIEIPSQIPTEMLSIQGADYLIIGSSDLLEPLKPLMAYRQEQGLSSLILPVETVYDRFNAGLPEPEAIHAMLQYAVSSWQTKPKYLLLVGDATYDPIGYLGDPGGGMLPVYYNETMYGGLTGSDLPYVDTNEDGKPDLAVGRLPASTPNEVRSWVEKTITYEQAQSEAEPFSVLAIADGQDASFRRDAQSFLDYFSGSHPVDLYSPEPGEDDAPNQIVSYFQAGYHMIGYFGHGSLNMWGRDKLLTLENVRELNNVKLPIVITMTCLNGFFFHPTEDSLAEGLLLKPDGGAVAVLAPTSLTLVWDQMVLGASLYPALAEPGSRRLGDVLLQAQQLMPQETQGQRDVLLTFLLFGDPALVLKAR